MANTLSNSAHLQRCVPHLNMQRFYSLSLQPTLFGNVALIRHWGRMGTKGQMKSVIYHDATHAHGALTKLVKIKTKKGYSLI